jgi:O-antigen/teichoic acid export membrane protein
MKIIRLLSSSFGAAIASLAIQLVLSHGLDRHDFGLYSTIASVLVIGAPFASTGINGLLLRRASINPSQAFQLIEIAVRSHFVLTAVFFIFTVVGFYFHGVSPILVGLLATYYIGFSAQGLMTTIFQINGDSRKVANVQAAFPFGRLIFVACAVPLTHSVMHVAGALAFANVCVGFLFFLMAGSALQKYRRELRCFDTRLKVVLPSIFSGFPYAINGTMNVAQIQIVVALSAAYLGVEVAANFAVANTILTSAYIIPNVVFGLYFLPKYHRLQAGGDLGKTPVVHGAVSCLVGFVVALAIFVLSPRMIPLLFSDKYSAAISIINVLILAIPFRFFSTAIGATLLSESKVKFKVFISVVAVALQVCYSVALGGDVSSNGIAIVVVASEIFVTVMYMIAYWHSLKAGESAC